MPLFNTEAIVLRSINYGESDRIVTFFTKDFGKIKGIAKGARKSRKRFQNALNLFTHIRLILFEREGMSLVRADGCDIICAFPKIREDLKKIFYANYFVELINEMSGEHERNPDAFDLLLFALRELENTEPKEEYMRIFEIRALSLFGYRPNIKRCNVCKKDLEDLKDITSFFFSKERGGVVCGECFKGYSDPIPISLGTLRAIEKVSEMSLTSIQRIKFTPQTLIEAGDILPKFIEYQLGKDLKSLKVLREVESIYTSNQVMK